MPFNIEGVVPEQIDWFADIEPTTKSGVTVTNVQVELAHP
jgi:hypothetical protein